MTVCGDMSLCCGDPKQGHGQSCCSFRKGLFLQDGKIVPTLSATATASTASASTAILSAAPSTSASTLAATSPPPSTNIGAIVGGVIAGVAATVILALAFWYWMIRGKVRQGPRTSESFQPYQMSQGWTPQEFDASQTKRSELGTGRLKTAELESS